MNVTFDFLRENLKPLLKFSFYVIFPLCLIQSFFMNSFMRMYVGAVESGDVAGLIAVGSYYGVLMLCILLGSILLSALVCSLMQTYERRDRRLRELVFADFGASFRTCCVKALRITLFSVGMVIAAVAIISLLAWISIWTLLLTLTLVTIGLLVVMVPFSLFTPLYLFEDLPFAAALRKAMKYGFSAWGEIFLVLLVFGLLANILSSITSLPWTIVSIVGSVFSSAVPDSGLADSVWYQFLSYILGVLMAYGACVSMIINSAGMAFQYFHLREKKEGVTMRTDIANFDRL
jgi:hypothetical protein